MSDQLNQWSNIALHYAFALIHDILNPLNKVTLAYHNRLSKMSIDQGGMHHRSIFDYTRPCRCSDKQSGQIKSHPSVPGAPPPPASNLGPASLQALQPQTVLSVFTLYYSWCSHTRRFKT
ncbi:hypothetical protein J6590_019093 [Homalodisca vitripennis]|nr:hypothetical protein J6590_019093 [Homalodisca vitripennis]